VAIGQSRARRRNRDEAVRFDHMAGSRPGVTTSRAESWPGQVLVKVKAAGITPVSKIREGMLHDLFLFPPTFPSGRAPPGGDRRGPGDPGTTGFAGVRFAPGTDIAGWTHPVKPTPSTPSVGRQVWSEARGSPLGGRRRHPMVAGFHRVGGGRPAGRQARLVFVFLGRGGRGRSIVRATRRSNRWPTVNRLAQPG